MPHYSFPRPSLEQSRTLALSLALGTMGGALFVAAGLPLPWMLGAMAAVTAGALAGLRLQVPQMLRVPMLAVLGVMLGSNFSPELLGRLGGWLPSFAGLLAFTIATPFIASQLFRRFGGTDPVTAYFSAAPGGLTEMVTVGAAYGGDERRIALVHALRILVVVFSVPLWLRATGEAGIGGGALSAPSFQDVSFGLADVLFLGGAAVLGLPVGKFLRLPAAQLTGPMVLSAVFHLTGWTALTPPGELVALAQVVIGSALGARFVGVRASSLAATAGLAFGSSAIMLGLAAAVALAASAATGLPFLLLLLAYVPGGVAEMSLIALALGMDVAFVATHHVLRIVLVVALAPLAFKLSGAGRRSGEP